MNRWILSFVVLCAMPALAMQELKMNADLEAGKNDFHQLTNPRGLRVIVDDSENKEALSRSRLSDFDSGDYSCSCPQAVRRHPTICGVCCALIGLGAVLGFSAWLCWSTGRCVWIDDGCSDPFGFRLNGTGCK